MGDLDSIKLEAYLNIFIRGCNALIGLYLVSIINPLISYYFSFLGVLVVIRALDFGYNYYQRHFNMNGFRLSKKSTFLYLLIPLFVIFWVIPETLSKQIYIIIIISVLLKYIGTHANIINKTWLIPLPIFITNVFFVLTNSDLFQHSLIISSLITAGVVYKIEKSKIFNKIKSFDNKLFKESIYVFIPSFLYIFLNEYLFVFQPSVFFENSKWIAIYLKISASMVSVIFLFNDMFWNRYGDVSWKFIFSHKFKLLIILSISLTILYPSIITLLTTVFLGCIISGYFIRKNYSKALLISGLTEASIYFIGLGIFGANFFFIIMGTAVSAKIIVMYYGKFFNI